MPNIYITDETKGLLEVLADQDCRTQDGEINYLCKQRVKELGLPDVILPSNGCGNCTKSESAMQENSNG